MRKHRITLASVLLVLLSQFAPSRVLPVSQPVVPLADVAGRCLLGGAGNGQWLEAADMARRMNGGERYSFYGLAGLAGEGMGTKPVSAGPPCAETFAVEFKTAPANRQSLLAVGGKWNAMPRSVTVLRNTAAYSQSLSEWLKAKRIVAPKPVIQQALRVDLEGDGVDEVLLSSARHAGGLRSSSQAGDYSLILLRKVVNGKAETFPVIAEYHARRGEFDAPSDYQLAAVLDVNGDGVMELIVHGKYYEGEWTAVYSVNGKAVEKKLSCGCGS